MRKVLVTIATIWSGTQARVRPATSSRLAPPGAAHGERSGTPGAPCLSMFSGRSRFRAPDVSDHELQPVGFGLMRG